MEGVSSSCVDCGWLRCLASYTLVVRSDFAPQIKTALIATLGATPLLTKFAAVALFGKEAINFLWQDRNAFLTRVSKARRGAPIKGQGRAPLFIRMQESIVPLVTVR